MVEQSPAVLNFTEYGLIHSIDFMPLDEDNLLLYWVNSDGLPYKINIKRAIGHITGTLFTDNFFYNGNVGFETNIGTMPFVVGDKVKIGQIPNATNPQYNTYAEVIAKPASNRIVVDLSFGVNTPPEGGYIYYDYAYAQESQQTLDVIKWQPPSPPVIQIVTDPAFKGNNIVGKFFQFSTRYVYDDYEKSCHSAYSTTSLPIGEDTTVPTSYVSYKNTNNAIQIQLS